MPAYPHIDSKYHIDLGVTMSRDGDRITLDCKPIIINTRTGEAIPEDEPTITFRSRDRLALRMLAYYRTLCVADECTQEHIRSLDGMVSDFARFRNNHPERMKQPGCTLGR